MYLKMPIWFDCIMIVPPKLYFADAYFADTLRRRCGIGKIEASNWLHPGESDTINPGIDVFSTPPGSFLFY